MSVYFPGLNGLRAIAALIVIFFHINVCMWFYGTSPIKYFETRDEMSRHAVVLFFVLSGYLITYLLLKEKKAFGQIDIKKFYLRRILRIWPLYYLAILLAIAFIPLTQQLYDTTTTYSLQTIALYALFVPNFALLSGYMIPTIAPLWSVGVEEQFYAFWPVLVNKSKSVFAFLLIFLFACIGIKIGLLVSGNIFSKFSIYFTFFSFDTLAIGGIAAYAYAVQHWSLKFLYNPIVQLGCWLFFAYSCVFGPINLHYLFDKELYSTAFALIILNVSTNPNAVIKLNGRIFDFLGRISYGMYIVHPFIIVLTAFPLRLIIPSIPGKPFQLIAISAVVVPITILISKLSYNYFEARFLKLKSKYTKVPSTNQGKVVNVTIDIPTVSTPKESLGLK